MKDIQLPEEILIQIQEVFDEFKKDSLPDNADDRSVMDEYDRNIITISLNDSPKKRATMWADRRRASLSRSYLRNSYYLLYLMALENVAHLYRVSQDRLGGNTSGCGLEAIDGADYLAKGLSSNLNYCRVVVERIAARLSQRHATMRSYPIKMGDLTAKKAAAMRDRLVVWMERQKHIHELKRHNSTFLPVFGTTFIATEWDMDEMAYVLDEEERQVRGRFGDIKFRLTPPYRMHFPSGIKAVNDTHWVIEDQLVTWGWLKQRFPDIAERLDPKRPEFQDADWVGSLGGFDERDIEDYIDQLKSGLGINNVGPNYGNNVWGAGSYLSNYADGNCDTFDEALPFRIHNCYERRTHPDLGEYWHFSRYCCGIELESRPYAPIFEDESGQVYVRCHGDGTPKTYDLPFTVFRYYEAPESFFGKSLIGDIIDPLRAIAALSTLLLKAAVDSTNTYVLHRKGNNLTPIVANILTMVQHRHDEPKFIKHRNQLTELQAMIEWLKGEVDSITMMPDVMQGENPNAGTSGRALEILASGASNGFDNIAARVVDGYAEMYSKAIDLYRFEVEGQRLLPGLGETDLGGVLAFKRHDLEGGTDVQVFMESSYSPNTVLRRAEAEQDYRLGAITIQEYRDIVKGHTSYDFVDENAQAENVAQRCIHYVVSMSDEEATNAYNTVLQAVQQAGSGTDDPQLAALEKMRARAAALEQFDLGVFNYEPIEDQARHIRRWLNSPSADKHHEDKVALIAQKWECLVDAGGRMAAAEMGLMQQAPTPSVEDQQPM